MGLTASCMMMRSKEKTSVILPLKNRGELSWGESVNGRVTYVPMDNHIEYYYEDCHTMKFFPLGSSHLPKPPCGSPVQPTLKAL